MITSLSLLPSCQSATQVAVKLKLDSLPSVTECVAAVGVIIRQFVWCHYSDTRIGMTAVSSLAIHTCR